MSNKMLPSIVVHVVVPGEMGLRLHAIEKRMRTYTTAGLEPTHAAFIRVVLEAGLRKLEPRPKCALTPDKVAKIKQLLRTGEKHKDIAERFGCGVSTISCIASGRMWPHVSPGGSLRRNGV
jgi:hypothetical protein